MYRTIIAAVDGSEHSTRALRQAANLARTFDSRLILVHAFPSTADIAGYSDYSLLLAKRKEQAQGVLDSARAELESPGQVAEEVLSEGPEAEAVLSAAESHDADLIVMGSRGLGTLQGWLLGSVSQKTSHLAKCPVLIVR